MVLLPTFHGSLQGVDGVDLCDNDASSEPTQSLDAALTHVTIARHHSNFTSNHHIGGTLDTVDQTLSAAVQIVKLALQGEDKDMISTFFKGKTDEVPLVTLAITLTQVFIYHNNHNVLTL